MTDQINLAISQQASFIESKTFTECIPRHFVEQLIENSCLKDKWDLKNYNQLIVSQNYINECEQLKSYLEKYNKKTNAFLVKYIKPKHKWGRVYPSRSLGSTSFAKKTRNTLIKDFYLDFDLKNAQPEILRNICIANNIPCDTITKYCNDREQIILDIIKASDNKVDRSLVKSLIISLSFYGTFKGWLEREGIEPFPEPVIVADYCNEIRIITEIIRKQNPDMFKTMSRLKKDKGETNVNGAFLSTYLQEIELRIVENILKHLCIETKICNTNTPNHFNAIYEFDGLKLYKESVDDFGGYDVLLELMNRLNLDFGFDVKWEIKPIEKFYDINFIEPVVVDKEADKLLKQREKRQEKNDQKQKEIEYALEKKKEILKIKCEKYSKMKTEFEKKHVKIISKGIYIEITQNRTTKERKLIMRSKKQLLDAYEHMAYDVDKEGNPVSFIYDWVKDPDIKAFEDADMYPIKEECPKTTFNMWNDFVMEQYTDDYEPDDEGKEFLLNHIKVLCNNDETIYEYFMKWLAHLIIHPDQKSTCPVFISKEGAGKGSFIELLKKLLGESKVLVTSQPDKYVWGSFNNLMNDAYFVALDELSKTLTTKANDTIKQYITDSTMLINNKGISSYRIKSLHKFLMMTNKDDGGIVTTKDDRRKFMVRCSDSLIGNKQYFDLFYEKIDNINIIRTFYDYIKSIEVERKLPNPPSNEYQDTLKELSINPIEVWLQQHSVEMIDKIKNNEGEWLFNESPYQKDLNNDIIWSATNKKMLESFNKFKTSNGFENYDIDSVKLGVRIKLLQLPFINKKHTRIGNVLMINLDETAKHFSN